MWHGEFRHERLVQVYDAVCRWGPDDDFFLAAVGEPPRSVADLGCGTGRLALALAGRGHRVSAVDPAGASLDVARAKPGAARVTWYQGTSEALPSAAFDAALMSAHVAQFVLEDAGWDQTLADLRRCLRPGGRLVFDTRDPDDRAWERWTRGQTEQVATLPDGSTVRTWVEAGPERAGLVDLVHHYVFDDGERLQATATMRWRSEPEIRGDLARARLLVEAVHGGWHREPVGAGDGELVVLARAPEA